MAKGIISYDTPEELKKRLELFKNAITGKEGSSGVQSANVKIEFKPTRILNPETKQIEDSTVETAVYYDNKTGKEVGYLKFLPSTDSDSEYIIISGGPEESAIYSNAESKFTSHISGRTAQTKKPIKETSLLNIYKSITNGR
jgi:hypothetical protein